MTKVPVRAVLRGSLLFRDAGPGPFNKNLLEVNE